MKRTRYLIVAVLALAFLVSGCSKKASESVQEEAAAEGAAGAADAGSPMGGTPPGHPNVGGAGGGTTGGPAAAPEGIDLDGIAKPAGGSTVAEIYSKSASLAGKEVLVRGKVVKFTPSIMATNWIHLRDGTGGEGTNDLTITTGQTVKVGDTILVRGGLTVDKDFGYGYFYPVIIENGEITVE